MIGDKALRESIALYNETRRLLRQVYALQRGPQPALSGAELVTLLHGAALLPREEYNRSLQAALGTAAGRRRQADGPRLLLDGSFLGEAALGGLLEDWGAQGVMGNLCVGSQTCWEL